MLSKIFFQAARKILLPLICMSFVFVSNLPAYSATYYVSPNGSATWGQALNTGTPSSAQTATTNAVAGDTVIFLDGTYNVGQQSLEYHTPILNPAHSGTSGNPITFQAESYLGVTLNGTVNPGSTDPDRANVIGAYKRDYIIWDGFKVTANSETKLATGRYDLANYCTFQNCEIVGASGAWGGSNNTEGFRIENANHITISNCIVHDFIETSNNHNVSGFKGYWTTYVTIENCEFYNCTNAIYPKNGNDNFVLKNTFIHDSYQAIFLGQDAGNGSTNVDVYNNLIINCSYLPFEFNNGSYVFTGVTFYNNTVYDCPWGIRFIDTADMKTYNNIFHSTTKQITSAQCNTVLAECDHNQFGTSTFYINTHDYCSETEGLYNSLASWQASTELNGSKSPGVGSMASDPLFSNVSGNMNTIADFALADGSPCKGAGRNGIDMGADISLVGVDSIIGEQDTPTPLPAPSNLKIQ